MSTHGVPSRFLIGTLAVIAAAVLFAAWGLLPSAAAGTTRYVASTGSDAGDCTVDPCLTIGYAIGQAASGDTISVAAGTYNESLSISQSLDIVGAGSDQVFVTGGVVISGTFDGLVLQGLHLSGDGPGPKNAVIDSRPTTDPGVSDITLRDNVLDGENTAGRGAFYGNFITGTWTWDGNEIKNFPTWYVIDNTGSSHDVPYKLTEVVFTDNHVHDVGGSIAFRGKIDEPMDRATVSGNTFHDYPASVDSQVWAAIEINNVQDLGVFENTITGVPEVQWGGEGEALQIWSASPWTVDIHDNDFTDNFMGIYIWGLLPGTDWSGLDTPLYVPGGSVNYNNLSNNTQFGIWISDLPAGSGTSSAIGGPMDAERNWWGDATGPSHTSNPHGTGQGGDAVSDNVDFTPWYASSTTTPGTENVTVTHNPVIAVSDTIEDAIDAALAGDTLDVAAGTYVPGQQLVIDKDLTISGTSAATTTLKPGFDTGGAGDARGWFLVNAGVALHLSDVTLDGTGNKVYQAIRQRGEGTVTDVIFNEIKYEESGPAYSGVGIAAFGTGPVDVTGSTFVEMGRIGVLYWGGATGSTFSGNTYVGKGAGDWLDYALDVNNGAVIDVSNNVISGNRGVASFDGSTSAGILVTTYYGAGTQVSITGNTVSDSSAGVAVGYGEFDTSVVTASSNNLAGNDVGVSSTAPSVDASGNWWGSVDAATVRAQADGGVLVDYSPWLASGADTDGGTPGFQGDFSVLHVDDDSPQSDATGHIQEGINLVSGSTVYVEPGTYDEALDIDGHSGLTVDGTDNTLVTVAPTTTLCWDVGGYGCGRRVAVRVVDSTDVVLQNMTMDFDSVKANGVTGVLYWDSTGEMAGNVLKNMSVDDLAGGYSEIGSYLRAPGYSPGARAAVTVSGNTFINAGRVAMLTHDFVEATIEGNTFYKTLDDFGYAIELGSDSTGTISGNTIYGYDTAAASDGSESGGIYVENCFTYDVASPGFIKDVAVTDNEVYDSQWGMVVGCEWDGFTGDVDIDLALTGNDLHDNLIGDALIADEDKEAGSSVSVSGGGNTLTTSNDYGYYIYTLGDGDVSVALTDETITGHDVGVQVDDTGGVSSTSSYDVSITLSNVSGNTTYGMNNTVSGLIVDAEKNWWGDATGPSHTSNPHGIGAAGNEASDGVDFIPWYATETTSPATEYVTTTHNPIIAYSDTIQGGVDAAVAGGGDLVDVSAGTYTEQVEIDKDLTLTGAGEGSTSIRGFDAMPLSFVTSGPNDNHPVVYVHDATGVVIEALTIDGDGKGNTNYRYEGIGVNNAAAIVQDVTVIDVQNTPFSGGQHGTGIYVMNDNGTDRTVTVDNATVYDFQKAGIAINGANAIGQVRYSTVTGIGPTGLIAQNGIQLGYGARGQISHNVVSGMVYTGTAWGATGILGIESGAISIDWNDVTACNGGIRVDNYSGVTTGVTIRDNTADGNEFNTVWGADTVTIERNSFDSGGQGLWIIDSADVSGSQNSFNGNDFGLIIDGAVDGVDMSNSDFRNNGEAGIVVEPYGADPVDVSIENSNIVGNGAGLENTSANVVLAENNWWGACDGPSGEGPGSGDSVSTNVDYDPWTQGKCDNDSDGLTNDAEDLIHLTDKNDPDTDKDGCSDGAELLFPKTLGGGRDPLFFWDFFDANRDGAVSAGDFFAVLGRFGAESDPPLTKEEALLQALEPPPTPPAYHASHDRTSPAPGSDPWDTGPPDGAIGAQDFFAVLAQFGHDCS